MIRREFLEFEGYKSASKVNVNSIFLNANEGPLDTDVRSYPPKQDPSVLDIFSKLYNMPVDNILMDRGIDGVFEVVFRALLDKNSYVVSIGPTYGMYKILAEMNQADYQEISFKEKTIPKNCDLFIICRPNNPCGTVLTKTEVKTYLDQVSPNAFVIIDEAYAEFLEEDSCMNLLSEYPNLIVTRTLSKAYSLAGLRVGFGLMSSKLVSQFSPFQAPYPIATPILSWIKENFTQQYIDKAQAEVLRVNKDKKVVEKLCKPFGEVFDGAGNFVTLRPYDSDALFGKLTEKGLVIRNFPQYPGGGLLRISIGTSKQTQILIKTLKELIQ